MSYPHMVGGAGGRGSWRSAALLCLALVLPSLVSGLAGGAAAAPEDPLDEAERAWLEANGPIQVAVTIGAPAAARLEEGELAGYFPDLLRLAALEVGARIEMEVHPNATAAQAALLAGEAHLAGPMAKRPALEGRATPSSPFAWVPTVLLVQEGADRIDGLADLEGRSVGALDGSPAQAIVGREAPGATVVPLRNVSQGVHGVASGELAGFAGPLAAMGHVMRTSGITGLVPVGENLGIREVSAWAADPGSIPLAILDAGLARISEDEAGLIHVSTTGFDLSQPATPVERVPGWLAWGGGVLIGGLVLVAGWAGVLRVQVRRRTEALEHHRDHLRDLVEDRTEALERSNEDLQRFASMASHDLREPLRTTSGFLHLLEERLDDDTDPDVGMLVDRARASIRRMDEMVEGLLRFSQVGTQGGPAEPVDLEALAAEVIEDLGARIEDSGGRVDVGALPTVHGDPSQLRQVLANLIGNALKFADPDRSPEVRISAETSGAGTVVRVRDNGIGLPPEHEPEAFDLFGRLQGSDDYEGSGMGLALCRRIVERHGGRIWVEPTASDVGTTIAFELPAPTTDDQP